MIKILVYNNDTNKFEIYYREPDEAMPFNANGTLLVKDFMRNSQSPTIWTTKRAMQSLNAQMQQWGSPIPVGYAFKRPWEGGHGLQSQHYAGVAFDAAQNEKGWNNEQRAKLRQMAQLNGLWFYIEPISISPTWVHMDRRQNPPACSAGYPLLKQGSISTYVLVLQDELNTLGFNRGGLDGVFGINTKNAVIAYQKARGLAADGMVGCKTWQTLQAEVVGKGRTANTID